MRHSPSVKAMIGAIAVDSDGERFFSRRSHNGAGRVSALSFSQQPPDDAPCPISDDEWGICHLSRVMSQIARGEGGRRRHDPAFTR